METTMFIFLLIGTAYFYKKRKAVPFAIFSGFILWGRPDGVAFLGALAVDYMVSVYISKTDKEVKLFSKQEWIKIGIIAGAFFAVYFTMNFILSGSILPNTYNAKLTYYSPEFKSRSAFLRLEVWDYFTKGAYGIVSVGFIFSVLKLFYDLFKKKYNENLLYIIFFSALVFIYWYKLPYAHRFGRYLMPAIPFILLAAFTGFRDASKLLGKYFKSRNICIGLFSIISIIILFISIKNYDDNKGVYATECKYISDRQVAAALWLKNNTQEGDIVATHDVGAIGYYSGRKIVDVAGLVTPELINKIGDKNYSEFLTDYIKKQGVTHLAFLREWYRVTNQTPLFSTINISPIETMEIYKFIPEKTHIMNKVANSGVMQAQDQLSSKTQQGTRNAIQILNDVIRIDPRASYTYLILTYAYLQANDVNNAEKTLFKALEIYPEYREALVQLAYMYKVQSKNDLAVKYAEQCLKLYPDDKQAQDIMGLKNDTTKVKKP